MYNYNKKKVVIIVMCIAIFVMITGYSLLSTRLNIRGTSNLTDTWGIKISNVTYTPTGRAYNIEEPTYTDTNMTFNVGVKEPGDKMTFEVVLKNYGSIGAILDDIEASSSGSPSINYSISGICAILSDVLVTISLFAIFKIEINFIFVAGILTIIGYSINNTIIVFDMIRDKMKSIKNINEDKIRDVINTSTSLTLKRNLLASLTTLIAVIILLLMNTNGVREFNLTILFGLTFGTFSSLYIAPYILYRLEVHKFKHPKIKKDVLDDEPQERLIKGINA